MAAEFLCTNYRRAEGPYDAGGVVTYSSRAPSLLTNLRLSTNAILSGIEQRQAGCAKVPGLFSMACHFGGRSLLASASARRTPSASKSAA